MKKLSPKATEILTTLQENPDLRIKVIHKEDYAMYLLNSKQFHGSAFERLVEYLEIANIKEGLPIIVEYQLKPKYYVKHKV
jgi:hypothetical protein